QKLDIYVPEDGRQAHTVVVFFHGGAWKKGTKDDYRFVGQALASRGYIAVAANYRLYPEVYFPGFMYDAAQATAWVHQHIGEYGGDARNLFVMGHSAGAHIAVMLAVKGDYLKAAGGSPKWLRGVIGLAGPYDFLPFDDPNIQVIFSKQEEWLSQP